MQSQQDVQTSVPKEVRALEEVNQVQTQDTVYYPYFAPPQQFYQQYPMMGYPQQFMQMPMQMPMMHPGMMMQMAPPPMAMPQQMMPAPMTP